MGLLSAALVLDAELFQVLPRHQLPTDGRARTEGISCRSQTHAHETNCLPVLALSARAARQRACGRMQGAGRHSGASGGAAVCQSSTARRPPLHPALQVGLGEGLAALGVLLVALQALQVRVRVLRSGRRRQAPGSAAAQAYARASERASPVHRPPACTRQSGPAGTRPSQGAWALRCEAEACCAASTVRKQRCSARSGAQWRADGPGVATRESGGRVNRPRSGVGSSSAPLARWLSRRARWCATGPRWCWGSVELEAVCCAACVALQNKIQ